MQITIKSLIFKITIFSFIINPLGPVSALFNRCPMQAYAESSTIPDKYQSEISKIIREQTDSGSIISEHLNEKESGHTTIKMLEIPEHQLTETIKQWSDLGNKINEDTINNNEFIKFLVNNTDMRAFSYTAKVPIFFFLVKNELAEKVLYGGNIKKYFKNISFPGWFRIAGALDEQGNYKKGFEHLATEKENLVRLFEGVLSKTVKGSYTIVELFTDEKGERKGRFKFFETPEQVDPSFVQPIDPMAAYVLVYLNLVQDDPGDRGVKADLAKPIVERLVLRTDSRKTIALLNTTLK